MFLRRPLHPSPRRSFFLFGARGTGRSTFLRRRFADARTLWIDLLVAEEEERYARRPDELAERVEAADPAPDWVVIDEVQKVPKLLDVAHRLIERRGTRFALTGSSARKLKRGTADLLAGRAFVHHLYPFTRTELGDTFHLDSVLMHGTLPGQYDLEEVEEKRSFLRAYALTYLKEEVWAEHVVRKLDPFRAFLEVAAQSNGEILNFSRIARDVGVDTKTVQSYFQILEDTLLGFMLEPFHTSVRKRQTRAPRFYFFDTGVKRALDRTLTVELRARTYAYGRAFEHLVIAEAIRRSHYLQDDYRFSYLRTKEGAEIDMIIERPGRTTALVEIKSASRVDESDLRTLRRFHADMPRTEAFCLCLETARRKTAGVSVMPWDEGLDALGLDIRPLLTAPRT